MFTFNLDSEVINIYNAPILNETKDGSGESGEFVLEFRTLKEPIKPHTEFSVYQDGNLIVNAIVESDEVEIVSKSPITYKHTIDYIAKAQALKNYFVRDSVITQPPIKQVSCLFSKYTLTKGDLQSTTQYRIGETSSETFSLPKKTKVSRAFLNVKIYQIKSIQSGYEFLTYENEITNCSVKLSKDSEIYTLTANETLQNGKQIELSTNLFVGGGSFTISDLIVYGNLYSESLENLIVSCELVVEYYYYNLYNVVEELKEQTELKEYV